MTTTVTEIEGLREQRAASHTRMAEIHETAEAADRDLTGEETQEFERHQAEFDQLTRRVERAEQLHGSAPQMTDQVTGGDVEPRPATGPTSRANGTPEVSERAGREAFDRFLRRNLDGMEPQVRATMNVGTDVEGGFLVADAWAPTLVESLREFSEIRQHARVFTTERVGTFNITKVAGHGAAAAVDEGETIPKSEATFGRAQLEAYKVARIVKATDEMVEDNMFDLVEFVSREAAESIALKEGELFTTGDGNTQRNGLFTAAQTGVTAAATDEIAADELIDLQHSIIKPYRRRGVWVLADDTLKKIRKLKDDDGQYLWRPGLELDAPDTLLGRPLLEEPFAPTVAAGADVICFGDLSRYWIRDTGATRFKFLNELYAEDGEVGWRVHRRSDGDLIDTAGVKVLTMAAS